MSASKEKTVTEQIADILKEPGPHVRQRLAERMERFANNTGGKHLIGDDDLILLLLMQLALDTRRMTILAEENTALIKETMNDVGRESAGQRG